MKPIMIRVAAWALLLSPALAQSDGYCYDAEQHEVKFSDLGSKVEIAQALDEACETPVGDHTYACNAAVSSQTRGKKRATGPSPNYTSSPRRARTALLTRARPITHRRKP